MKIVLRSHATTHARIHRIITVRPGDVALTTPWIAQITVTKDIAWTEVKATGTKGYLVFPLDLLRPNPTQPMTQLAICPKNAPTVSLQHPPIHITIKQIHIHLTILAFCTDPPDIL